MNFIFILIQLFIVSTLSQEVFLSIFKPFKNSFIYHSANKLLVHSKYHEAKLNVCQTIDLIGNYSTPEDRIVVSHKIQLYTDTSPGPFCPFLFLNDYSEDFIQTLLNDDSYNISLALIVKLNTTETSYAMKSLIRKSQVAITFLIEDEFRDNFYKVVRTKDLSGNYLEFRNFSPPSLFLNILEFLIIASCVAISYMLAILFLHYDIERAVKGLLKNPVQGKSKCSQILSCIGLVIMFLVSASFLMLLYFFYDKLIYFILSIFLLYNIYAGVYVGDFFLRRCIQRQDHVLIKLRKFNITVGKVIFAVLFAMIGAIWVTIRRYEPIGPMLEAFLGVIILSYILFMTYEGSLKYATCIFVVMIMYDVLMVYISPFWNITNKIASPFATLGQMSVMESVARGMSGLSGEPMPFLFKVRLSYYGTGMLLGYGDVIIPGFLIVSLMFYDTVWQIKHRIHVLLSLLGYYLGLVICVCVSRLTGSGQPALLFICPAVLVCVYCGIFVLERLHPQMEEHSFKFIWDRNIINAPLVKRFTSEDILPINEEKKENV